MVKAQKRKARGRDGSTDAKAERPAAPTGAEGSQPPFTPNPPRRNMLLLVASVVMLVAWLTVLTWLAATS